MFMVDERNTNDQPSPRFQSEICFLEKDLGVRQVFQHKSANDHVKTFWTKWPGMD